IFNDRMIIKAGVATLEDCAFQVFTSVVSRAGSERGILDAGSKTLTSDSGGLDFECLAYFVNFFNVSVKQLRYGVIVWVRLSQGGCHLIATFFNCLHLEFIDSLVHFRHPHDR
ncbi:hypothetical protein N9412_01150, partial [bacterium]|nr:hypothetical protein [bacterium]